MGPLKCLQTPVWSDWLRVTWRLSWTGVPRPTLSWHRKEGPLGASASPLPDGSLLLRNLTPPDYGTYSCVAANSIGKSVASSLLRVAEWVAIPIAAVCQSTLLRVTGRSSHDSVSVLSEPHSVGWLGFPQSQRTRGRFASHLLILASFGVSCWEITWDLGVVKSIFSAKWRNISFFIEAACLWRSYKPEKEEAVDACLASDDTFH